jgi:hypothetical protein
VESVGFGSLEKSAAFGFRSLEKSAANKKSQDKKAQLYHSNRNLVTVYLRETFVGISDNEYFYKIKLSKNNHRIQ